MPDPLWAPTSGDLARVIVAALRSDPDPQTKWAEARRQINAEIVRWSTVTRFVPK